MIVLLCFVGYFVAGIATGFAALYYALNYNENPAWKDLTEDKVTRDFLGMFYLAVFAWPMILVFLAMEIWVLSTAWFKEAMDKFAKRLFNLLKRKK